MIDLIPYDAAHMDLFEQSDDDIERYGEINKEMSLPMAEHGTCFTAIKDGRILCVGGVLQVSKHTGHCWTMVSVHAKDHGKAVLHCVKTQLETMMRSMGLHRVETSNLFNATDHHKWCRALGFKEEGVMMYYDDKGRHYKRFAKFSGE